eukprot:795239-Pleurochrysis_carterae.AAC.1
MRIGRSLPSPQLHLVRQLPLLFVRPWTLDLEQHQELLPEAGVEVRFCHRLLQCGGRGLYLCSCCCRCLCPCRCVRLCFTLPLSNASTLTLALASALALKTSLVLSSLACTHPLSPSLTASLV